jgi:hypothetical protein
MRPEVPEKSQETRTARCHSFGSMQSVRVRCGLVFVHRWSALNERQRVLLERLVVREEPGAWAPGEWRSAYALRDRGLLTVSRGGGDVRIEVTEAGRFTFGMVITRTTRRSRTSVFTGRPPDMRRRRKGEDGERPRAEGAVRRLIASGLSHALDRRRRRS